MAGVGNETVFHALVEIRGVPICVEPTCSVVDSRVLVVDDNRLHPYHLGGLRAGVADLGSEKRGLLQKRDAEDYHSYNQNLC